MKSARTWLIGTATATAVLLAPITPAQAGTAAAYANTTVTAVSAWSNTASSSTGRLSATRQLELS